MAVKSHRETLSLPVELWQSLCAEAGIRGAPERISLLGVSTCAVWRLTVGDQHYVVRQRLDRNGQLAHKEAYLSDRLRRNDVPVAEVLAMVADEHGIATLNTWLKGIPLDQAMVTLSLVDLQSAWYSIGEALRRAHEICFPMAGEFVGVQIEPFPGGWAQWVLEDLADDINWLQAKLNMPQVSRSRLEQVAEAAVRALVDASVCLIHNDALPQNILVAQEAHDWICTGLLDWEFARAADPQWDISTLDFRPARLVPSSFYAGYGWQPAEPQVSLYELLMATWRTRAELEHGSHWAWPPQEVRIRYLHRLPEQIERLAALLDVRP